MPNYGTYAICPYFSTEDVLHIKCEGMVQQNSAVNVMKFATLEKKKEWLHKYCETYQYGLCPYAAIKERQYEETYGETRKIIIAKKAVKPVKVTVKKKVPILEQMELSDFMRM